jgi:flagellin FlaB
MRLKMFKDERAFTGLEAAIVLIAFVVVAAVFSYIMLGAGFFTTQKSKQVVHTGVGQASTSLELDGQYIYIVPKTTGSSGNVSKIYFFVTLTAGGNPVDLNQTLVSIKTPKLYKQVFFGTNNQSIDPWYYEAVTGVSDGDNLVEKSEKYKITLNLEDDGWNIASSDLPGTDDEITIEIKPPVGAPLIITKTLPPSFKSLTYV